MRRRDFLATATAGGGVLLANPTAIAAQEAAVAAAPPEVPATFGFENAAAEAQRLAASDFVSPKTDLVGAFANVSYDQYRGIRFRRDHDTWAGISRFGFDLLPPGLIYQEPIQLFMVTPGGVNPVPFDPRAFEFQADLFPEPLDLDNLGEMGWSGFRLRTELNRPDVLDEFAVFQGASYFRAVARGTTYGLSARGLALNTGLREGEEFPLFRTFWLHQPGPYDRSVTIHALLDSISVAGAFEFVLEPGADTVITTRVALFPRERLEAAGIAPLTSMFWFSSADRDDIDDYRSAVHDSDGLQMLTGSGTRMWRVLSGPATLQLSDFQDSDPGGFGLVQRARRFDDYGDSEARYDTRPSAWIVPHGPWGKGAVGLVEIPVENEFHDNIVSFWRPGQPLDAGQRYDFGYDMTIAGLPPDSAGLGRVIATKAGRSVNNPDARSFMIDFDATPFANVSPRITVSPSAGQIGHSYVSLLPTGDRLRLAFDFLPGDAELADISATLSAPDGTALSETWVARWVRN